MPREPRLFLAEMMDACERVIQFVDGVDMARFIANVEKRSAVERQLFIIGEAANQIPIEVQQLYPEVPWRPIIGLRNMLAHGYWGLDASLVWDTAHNKVPLLLAQVRAILDALG